MTKLERSEGKEEVEGRGLREEESSDIEREERERV